ncbi:hypothetical protein [Nitratifractor sp.]
MKKTALALLCALGLQAADHDLYTHSVQVVGEYSFNSDDMYLKDGLGWGLRYAYNFDTVNPWEIGALQFAFDYQFDEGYVVGGSSAVYRWGVNALWYADNPSDLTPFALLGLGAQFFTEEEHGVKDGLFGAVGGGVEYQLRGDLDLVGEGKFLYGGDESAFVTTIGFKYNFGQ